ncbi:MAG: hypothetical protein K2M13_01855 [Muribaculaceae bacterium]|nr:hypothetical protein [Muribaculaceae bacterium]
MTEEIETKKVKATLHVESADCFCSDCKSRIKQYAQILDMERYVEHLNDWD